MKWKRFKFRRGLNLLEILLAMTVLAITAGALLTLFFTNDIAGTTKEYQEQAAFYAEEGLAIVRNIKADNFTNLADGNYGLSASANEYTLVTDYTETVGTDYSRTVVVAPVYRNASNEIDPSGQTLDNSTKEITVTVTWTGQFGGSKSVVLTDYLTDWEGTSWFQTTQTHFNTGTATDTVVVATAPTINDNGGIELAVTSGEGFEFIDTVNVGEKANDVNFAGSTIYAAVEDSSDGFCSIDFTDPANATLIECIDVGDKAKAIAISGDYAFVMLEDSSDGFAVVDISDPTDMSVVTTLDVGDKGVDIEIQGNHAYVTVEDDDSLVIVDIANPNSPFVTATANPDDKGSGITVAGNYAYLGTDADDLVIYDISNPNSPVELGSVHLGGDLLGAVYKDSYLYISGDNNSTGLEVVNVANPNAPFITSSHSLNSRATDMDILGDLLYLSVEEEDDGLEVWDISDPLNPTRVQQIDVQGKGKGVHVTDSYVFIATETDNKGVAIITNGGSGFIDQGTFESQIHDTGSTTTTYRYISWLSTLPAGTTLNFQIRTADTEVNMASATYVGPDGTASSYYTASPGTIVLDPSRSGQQFVQWQAYMTSDGNATPTLDEVTIRYE